jgi:hypothetical protein
MVFVILLRGVLSLLGHGTWTALLASVLFREGRERHFRLKGKVLGAYVLVVVLHGLWDGLPGFISAVLSPGLDVLFGQAAGRGWPGALACGGVGVKPRVWLKSRQARARHERRPSNPHSALSATSVWASDVSA